MISFAPQYTLTPRMQRQLVAIDRCVGFLEAVDIDEEWRNNLRNSARLKDAVSSLQIEGSGLTLETAFKLVTASPRPAPDRTRTGVHQLPGGLRRLR